MLEVKLTGQRGHTTVMLWPPKVARMAVKPLLTPCSLGGCTINIPPLNCHQREGCII